MPNDVKWIKVAIQKARQLHPSVTDAVSARTANELEGQLSQRQLTPTEFTKLAIALIKDMTSSRPVAKANPK